MEQWRQIKDWEHYEVSTTGKLRNSKGKILKERVSKFGYIHYLLQDKTRKSEKYIQRLVAETFIPNHNNLNQVNHKDNNKGNNNVENLEWVTAKENVVHATKHYHRNCGENNYNAKITMEQARLIHRMLACNVKQSDIAKALNIPCYIIYSLRRGGWAIAKEN